jgi:PAS domain S-box-containing protein
MFKKIKIGAKITLLLLTVVALSVLAISYLSFVQNEKSIEKRFSDSFIILSSLKAQQIDAIFKQVSQNVSFIGGISNVKTFLDTLKASGLGSQAYIDYSLKLDEELVPVQSIYQYEDIMLVTADGRIVYKANKEDKSMNLGKTYKVLSRLVLNAAEKTYFGEPFNSQSGVRMFIAHPVTSNDESKKVKGFIVILLNVSQVIYPITDDRQGVGNTGEIVLSMMSGSRVKFISALRYSDASILTEAVLLGDNTSIAVQRAAKGEPTDYAYDTDYRNILTLSSWSHIPTVGWGLVVKMDKEEMDSLLDDLVNDVFKYGALIVILSVVVSSFFSQFFTTPIHMLRKQLGMVAKGMLPEKIKFNTADEIGEMAVAVDNLVNALKRTADFAHQIGKGNYEAEFRPMSDSDTLGNALMTMRDSIQSAEKKEKERNWIVTGIAEIGQILRNYNRLEELSDHVIKFVTEKIGAVQGAFYVVNDEKGEPTIEMKASYAYHRKKYLKSSFKFAEGLVGQSAIERDKIIRTEIPDDYVHITSGLLGDKRPRCILIVPLITDEVVYGVLEFASLHKFSQKEIDFVQEISVIIARTIFNIKVNERTVRLLEESQKMSQELKAQQEVLRQNAEEMEATQEELKKTNVRLEEQVLEVSRTQKRTQLLLENASEVITIYEKSGIVRYISPSVEPILGYTQEEMIGSRYSERVHIDNQKEFEVFFNELVEKDKTRLTIQYEYSRKDGKNLWLEATGINLLPDPAIQGIVLNVRDITERKRAEQEERMRSQMQALSENSPDLIKRLNHEGVFFYINPTIKILTGRNPDYFLNKHLHEVHLNPEIISAWQGIFNLVVQKREKVELEMDFPSIAGERIMMVNAIPEFGEHEELESVLIVSHDITDRKRTEMEMRTTNKKITESINYAKRIQSAILPDSYFISKSFKDSFILYKPRDVVSGDFPWFMQKENDLYIAAVDCTGHGVPGALISLIGYFILNDVVNTLGVRQTGKILDNLNMGVTRTLKQDSGGATRDGMDIGLCRVNYSEGFLEYSGAHRPMYYLTKSDFHQFKGDNSPVGGGYAMTENFSTHKMEFNKGDELYLFSDGLPDQFGGEENKKFGPKRIRTIITESGDVSMSEKFSIFEQEFISWKGDRLQTDDILVIGIRL